MWAKDAAHIRIMTENDAMLNLWSATAPPSIQAPPLEGDATADVAVIGGGFTGLSAALHLALEGADIRLIEARSFGHGGSGRNVGLVNAGLWTPPAEIETMLGAEAGTRLNDALAVGPDLVFSLIERFHIACEATRNGTLHLAHSARGFGDLRNRHRQQIQRGAPVTLLGRAQTAERTGSEAFHGALHDARAGTIQPLAYVHGLARAAADSGARLHTHTPALGWSRDAGGWRIGIPAGSLRAKRLIHATNAYDTVLPQARAFTPVFYLQFATSPVPEAQRGRLLPRGEGCWDTATVMSSFRFDRTGRLVIGGVGNPAGWRSSTHRHWARRKVRSIYPALADLDLEFGWRGRIAMTDDHLPRIVALGEDGISIFGYSGRGIGPGTVFGKCAAQWAMTGAPESFPLPLSRTRSDIMAPVKAACYDLGSLAAHLVGARLGGS